jgi:hypothetical protein
MFGTEFDVHQRDQINMKEQEGKLQTDDFTRMGSNGSYSDCSRPISPQTDVALEENPDDMSENEFSDSGLPTVGEAGWGRRDETLTGFKSGSENHDERHRNSKWNVVSNMLGFVSSVNGMSTLLELPSLKIPAHERTQEDLRKLYEKLRNNFYLAKLGLNLAKNAKVGIKLMAQVHTRLRFNGLVYVSD